MIDVSYAQQLFQSLLQNTEPSPALDKFFPWVPLNDYGMPLPGPNFTATAVRAGDPAPTIEGTGAKKHCLAFGPRLHYLYRRALYDSNSVLTVDVKGVPKPTSMVPGHLLGGNAYACNGGPRPAKVMLIGKHPGIEELAQSSNLVGPSSEELWKAMEAIGLSPADYNDWYATNLVKWPNLDPHSDGLPKAWINDCRPLLEMEIRICQPDYILCLGSDSSKALLGTSCGVEAMNGRVMHYSYPSELTEDGWTIKTAKVMTSVHPAYVSRRPELFDSFKDQLALFVRLAGGGDVGGEEKDVVRHYVYSERRLAALVDAALADPEQQFMAFDGEWHGQHPQDENAYLRTIQFSTQHKQAVTVVLRHQGGAPAFIPNIAAAIRQLKRLTTPVPGQWEPRVGGHFFRADLPWLLHEGLDLRDQYAPHPDPAVRDCGGWDTSLLYHAVNETASFKLEDIAMRLTSMPRYDVQLQRWKKIACKILDEEEKTLEGYGMAPDEILHPYSASDADATRRIAKKLLQADPDTGQLTLRDSYGNDCWLPYWISHSASLAFLEMEMTGILVDFARVDSLTAQFMQVYEQLLAWFRKQINWEQSAPDAPVKHSGFNPNSSGHAKAFLFGDKFATRKDPVTKLQIPIRPPTAMTLGLTPIKSTGRRPKLWEVLQRRGELSGVSPSTDKETLGILGQKHPLAMTLRDLKFISQVLKSVLRRPNINKETGEPETTEEGFWEYDDGLVVYAGHDGRVRTHIYQTKETGRCSSARPALQCISKRREDDYRRILGYYDKKKKQDEGTYKQLYPAQYAHPLRSVLRATPGYVLVECDYTGAELAVIAWLSGDQNMIEHVRRNALPEDHPEFFDIHSQTAVRVFHLDCPPTKKGLKDAGFSGMRVAAKNVNFGVPYGRGAEAIARQCREEGVDVTPEQTQAVINFYFEQYPGTAKFLQQCRDGVVNPGWLSTAFGRLRRFTRSYDKSVLGEQERSAMNAPIQGTVADAVYRALAHLRAYRQERPALDYRLLLQIHDAILFEVRWDCVNEFVRVAAPECMVRRVPVWPRYLDGSFMPVTQPYFFSIDKEICVNWGEPITEAEAVAMGIDPELV